MGKMAKMIKIQETIRAAKAKLSNRALRSERHSTPGLLSNFILGSQDGLVNVLGITLGLAAAHTTTKLLFVAALAALAAETVSMAAVAYTSTVAKGKVYLKEEDREKQEMKNAPEMEKQEVKSIFLSWGYSNSEAEELTLEIMKRPNAMLEFMMAYELHLEPVKKREAFENSLTVGTSTIFGSFIPLIAYFFSKNMFVSALASVILCGVVLFLIGVYEAKTTVGSLWKSGFQLAIIGLTAGLAGYLIGYLIGAAPV